MRKWELRNDNLPRGGLTNHFLKCRLREFRHSLRASHLRVDIARRTFKNGPTQGVVFQRRRGTARHAARERAEGFYKRNRCLPYPLGPGIGIAIRKLSKPTIDIRLDTPPLPRPKMKERHFARGTSVHGGHGQLRLPHWRSRNDPSPGFGASEDETADSKLRRIRSIRRCRENEQEQKKTEEVHRETYNSPRKASQDRAISM